MQLYMPRECKQFKKEEEEVIRNLYELEILYSTAQNEGKAFS